MSDSATPTRERVDKTTCPHCHEPIGMQVVIDATKEQRFAFVIEPQPGSLMSATGVGGALEATGRLFESDLDAQGFKAKVAIQSIETLENGTLRFNLVLARVAAESNAPEPTP